MSTAHRTMLLCLAGCLFLGLALANPDIQVHNIRPNTVNQTILLPSEPTNAYYKVTYPGIVQDVRPLKAAGQCWITRVANKNDDALVHHTIAQGIFSDSSYAQPGGPLDGVQDGDTILDTLPLGAGEFTTLYADQVGMGDLNLLKPDEDDSVANGYTYGIPLCHTDVDFIVWQFHAHKPHGTPEGESYEIPIHYTIRTTSVPPQKNVGYQMGGVIGIPALVPYSNTTDSNVIDAVNRGGLLNCASAPGATPCEDCCQTPGTLPWYDDFAFGRAELSGIATYELIGGFVHAHHLWKGLDFSHIPLGGEEVKLYSLENPHLHGGDTHAVVDAFQWLDAPVPVRAGDAFRTRCEYRRHAGMESMPIPFGFASSQEMCNSFFLIATDDLSVYGGKQAAPFLPMGGFCEVINNPGTPEAAYSAPASLLGVCGVPPCFDSSTATTECFPPVPLS